MSVSFELPWPPTVNTYWRQARGRIYISERGTRFRKEVADILLVGRVRPLGGPLALTLNLYPPDKRRRDIDNVLKATLDALQHGGLYRDDNQIKALTVFMHDTQEDTVHVHVMEIPVLNS